ncbi:MAG: DUF1801 domain-containing protein [Anaerolineales bacterium]
MVSSKAKTVAEYLKELPADRRSAVSAVRKVILDNLPAGYKEGMFGMIGYYVPLKDFPDTYNGQPLAIAGLAAQKNYNSLYLMAVYGNREIEAWFKERYKASGKKLDMGKSCIRFKRAEDLPLELIAETIAKVSKEDYIRYVEGVRGSVRKTRGS